MALFLRDVLDEKLKRNEADAQLFRSVVQYEFASGLDATAEGAAIAMRRWVKTRPSWVSDIQQARRLCVLAAIEAMLSSRARKIAQSSIGPETAAEPERKRAFPGRDDLPTGHRSAEEAGVRLERRHAAPAGSSAHHKE